MNTRTDHPIAEARKNLSDLLASVRLLRDVHYMTSRGRRQVALIPADLGELIDDLGGPDEVMLLLRSATQASPPREVIDHTPPRHRDAMPDWVDPRIAGLPLERVIELSGQLRAADYPWHRDTVRPASSRWKPYRAVTSALAEGRLMEADLEG